MTLPTVSRKQVEEDFDRASDHPNAPPRLKRKAARQKRKAALAARAAPTTLDGWRAGYFRACESFDADLDEEMQLIVDGLHELAGERLARRADG